MPTPLNTNLLVDPGAEQATPDPNDYDAVVKIPGWTTTSNMTVDIYGEAGGDLSVQEEPPGGGANYFYGGPNNSLGSATQTISFSDLSLPINARDVTATVSGYLGGFDDQADHANVSVVFLNARGDSVGSASISGPESFPGASRLEFESTTVRVPVGAVSATYKLTATRENGSDNDGLADNLSFVLKEVPCFLPGTGIRTPDGEILVERLAVGDVVVTAGGTCKPVVWIGVGRTIVTRGRRSAATPVIVRKGALGDNIPHRDLRITKGHSLYLDGVLIPAEFLVNHRSILWDDHAQEVSVYHIELATHNVLLANGTPAESYRDDGNRWLFRNANSGWDRPTQEPFAPVLTGGSVVDAVWRRLLDRAGPRKSLPLTEDADLHVLMGGKRLEAAERVDNVHVFRLSAIPSALHVVSRAAAPAELGLARDPRLLGVALRRLAVRKGARFRVIEAKDDRLTDGFHPFEPNDGLRWTDGDATIPTELYDGFTAPLELVVHVGATARYLADNPIQRVA